MKIDMLPLKLDRKSALRGIFMRSNSKYTVDELERYIQMYLHEG